MALVRLTDVNLESDLENECPLAGIIKVATLPVDEAVEQACACLRLDSKEMAVYVSMAKRKAARCLKKNAADTLTGDEIAAINLYTHETDLQRQELRPAFCYLKLLLTRLHKLPTRLTTVYRGVKLDIASKYQKDEDVVWWGFSSATASLEVLKSPQFLGDQGNRTLFAISNCRAVDIRAYSAIQVQCGLNSFAPLRAERMRWNILSKGWAEDERLLLPGAQLHVKGVLDVGAGFKMVQLEDQPEAPSLLLGFCRRRRRAANTTRGEPVGIPEANAWNGGSKLHKAVVVKGTYTGDLVDGEAHGTGTWTHPSGAVYEGEYKHDKRDGHGTYTCGAGSRYEGDWKNDMKEGLGAWTHPDGDLYEGEFKNDFQEGHGTYTYPDRAKYLGAWKHGVREGRGAYTAPDGAEYVGEYRNGNREGLGMLTLPNGSKRLGEWVNGELHGRNTLAQNSLAVCYEDGQGVQKDEQKAVEWYQMAAEAGNADAQFNLALCYQNGEGVQKDDQKAARSYQKAAEAGNALAQFNLAVFYEDGQRVQKDEQKAAEWYQKAADTGYAGTQYRLAWCYENGQGMQKDQQKAVELYKKEAENGSQEAIARLQELEEEDDDDDEEEAAAAAALGKT
eukprot:g59634.t1